MSGSTSGPDFARGSVSLSEVAPSNSLTDLITTAFGKAESEDTVIAFDVGIHMSELRNEIQTSDGIMKVYRTRLQNYPWAFDPDGRPKIKDLVVIEVTDGNIWYISEIPFYLEISLVNLDRFTLYDNQLIPSEVGAAVTGGILTRVESRKGTKTPAFLMSSLLSEQSRASSRLLREILEDPIAGEPD